MKLNEELLKKMKVSDEKADQLEDVYAKLSHVISSPDGYVDPVEYIQEIEYKLQTLWGFHQDHKYHRYWKAIKGCSCPYMDNEDPLTFGTGRRIINNDCKWHGEDRT